MEKLIFENAHWVTPGRKDILHLCEDITILNSEKKIMGRFLWFIEMRAVINNGIVYSDMVCVRYD